jgi:iron-sulfur cluster repair protein YtfE (RIC family)
LNTLNSHNNQKTDKLKRQAEVNSQEMGHELSPMSPPEAYEPPSDFQIPLENLHPFLQELTLDHVEVKKKLSFLKETLNEINIQAGPTKPIKEKLASFLQYFHEEFVPHNKKEETYFFTLLNEKLLEKGEHSQSAVPFTGIKILIDDHVHAIRIGGAMSHLLNLLELISDAPSRNITYNQIFHLGKELIELLELHVFREDNIIFGQAQELLTLEEMDGLLKHP